MSSGGAEAGGQDLLSVSGGGRGMPSLEEIQMQQQQVLISSPPSSFYH